MSTTEHLKSENLKGKEKHLILEILNIALGENGLQNNFVSFFFFKTTPVYYTGSVCTVETSKISSNIQD